jgi:hypothetical protein
MAKCRDVPATSHVLKDFTSLWDPPSLRRVCFSLFPCAWSDMFWVVCYRMSRRPVGEWQFMWCLKWQFWSDNSDHTRRSENLKSHTALRVFVSGCQQDCVLYMMWITPTTLSFNTLPMWVPALDIVLGQFINSIISSDRIDFFYVCKIFLFPV